MCRLKGMNKVKKKNTANTIALKTRVPGEGTQESRQLFFLQKKEWTDNSLIELLTGLAYF